MLQDEKEYGYSKESCKNETHHTECFFLNIHSRKLPILNKLFIRPKHTYMTEDNKNGSQLYKPKKQIELTNIIDSNTIVNPRTMMIISIDTGLTNKAMILVPFLVSTL